MIGTVIYKLLSTSIAITAIVSADKITPVRRLQDVALPAITYELIDTVPTNTKDGKSLLDTKRISVHCWSYKYSEAATIANKVRSVLDRYSGTVEGIEIDKIVFDNNAELIEDEVQVYHHIVDFKVRIKRDA
jgi:hypothetical protein